MGQEDDPRQKSKIERLAALVSAMEGIDLREVFGQATDPETKGRISEMRARLSSVVDSLGVAENRKIGEVYRGRADSAKESDIEGVKIWTYEDMKAHLERKGVAIKLPQEVIEKWTDLALRRRWFSGFRTRSKFQKDELPKHPLDICVELAQMKLRKLPYYGENFTIDPKKLRYEGDINKLIFALQNDLVINMLVEAYPASVHTEDMQKYVETWFAKCVPGLITPFINWEDNVSPCSGELMFQAVGQHKIKFLCSLPTNSHLHDPTLSMPAQIKKLGGRYPQFIDFITQSYFLRYKGLYHGWGDHNTKITNVIEANGKFYQAYVTIWNGEQPTHTRYFYVNSKTNFTKGDLFVI